MFYHGNPDCFRESLQREVLRPISPALSVTSESTGDEDDENRSDNFRIATAISQASHTVPSIPETSTQRESSDGRKPTTIAAFVDALIAKQGPLAPSESVFFSPIHSPPLLPHEDSQPVHLRSPTPPPPRAHTPTLPFDFDPDVSPAPPTVLLNPPPEPQDARDTGPKLDVPQHLFSTLFIPKKKTTVDAVGIPPPKRKRTLDDGPSGITKKPSLAQVAPRPPPPPPSRSKRAPQIPASLEEKIARHNEAVQQLSNKTNQNGSTSMPTSSTTTAVQVPPTTSTSKSLAPPSL